MHIIKPLTVIFCLTFIFRFAVFSGNCQQNDPDWGERGDSLYLTGQYSDAAIAFERAIFSQQARWDRTILKLKKADCYKQLGKYQKALALLETIFVPGLRDSLKWKVMYQKSLCHFLNQQPEEALLSLQQLPESLVSNEMLGLEVLTFADLGQWENAKEKMRLVIEKNNTGTKKDSLMAILTHIFRPGAYPQKKNQKKAALLSTFLPGIGQCYSGYPGKGLLAFTFTAGSIAVAVVEIMNGFYVTGYVVGLGFFQKFYFGGIEQSRRLAEERTTKNALKFNESVKKLLFSSLP